MTISSNNRKAGPFIGNGSAATFPFTFKVFQASDLFVVRLTVSTGTQSTLVLGTDYTVTLNLEQDSNPGGSITLVAGALASGYNLIITSDIGNLQPTDLTNQGGFYPEVINDSLDRATIQIQQLQEQTDRTLKYPVTDPSTGTELPAVAQRAGKVLTFDELGAPIAGPSVDEVGTILDNLANITTVANDLNGPDTIGTVATNIADVNTVASNMADVNTVADNIADVGTVATNIADVIIAADNVADINNFADVYQGAKASDPTLRNNGSPLQPGDMYFNTSVNELRLYSGSVWVAGTAGTVAVQRFSGTGSQTAFTLTTAPSGENNTQVYINGVYQQKDTYGVTGTTLTFSTAPPAGTDNIEVVTISTLALGETDASLVTFLPAGAGAVERTVQSKLRDGFSVQDFGAVGNGTTDDTAAFVASAAQKIPVFVPANRRYVLTQDVTGNFYSDGYPVFKGGGQILNHSFIRNHQTNDEVVYNGSSPIWAFGDSFTVGQGATTVAYRYINRIAQKLNQTVNNYAVSGRASFEATKQLFNIPNNAAAAVNKTTGLVTWMAAFNDVYRGGSAAKTLLKIQGELRSFLSALFATTAVGANDVATTTGTWTALATNFAGDSMRAYRSLASQGRQSLVNGSTLTQTITGDNVVIHTFATDGVNQRCGSFTVAVDGTVLATYNGDGKTDGIFDGSYSNQITHDAVVLTGLGSGSHTVVITAITDGVKPVYIDTIETMMPPTTCAAVLVAEGAFQPDEGWAQGGGIWSQKAMEASTDAVNQVVEEFAGYPIAVVRTNDYFNTTNGISADNNHPNDTGHAQIAAAFLAAVRFGSDVYNGSLPAVLKSVKVVSPTSPTRFDMWNTYNDANNRNWTWTQSQNSYGDIVLRYSNAKDGDPVAAGTDFLSFTTSLAQFNKPLTVNNSTLRVTNNNSPTRLDVYNTFANTGNRNWSILNSQNVWGDMVIRVSTAQNGDPVSAGNDIISFTASLTKIGTQFAPTVDNSLALGGSGNRWSVVYAGTGTINTSDEREKQQIKPIDGAALRAWAKVEYCQFKFNDAVEAKGDGARWHFGLIAQKVKEAFESEGLDAFTYGLLCYDEWADEYEDVFIVEEREVEETPVDGGAPIKRVEVTRTPTGEKQLVRAKGNRYGIRYEEALALECAYLRSKLGV